MKLYIFDKRFSLLIIMLGNKIEFKITTDYNGKHISLENMSVHAAKALGVFIESITAIAEVTGNNISITKGSICVAIEEGVANGIDEITNEIDEIANYKSIKPEWVEPMRKIQSIISANGLHYEVNVIKSNQTTSLLNIFQQKKKFKVAQRTRQKPEVEVVFIEGELKNNGGDNPNIHISSATERYTIACQKEEAIKVKNFLYDKIMVSAWKIKKPGQKAQYTFCDHYAKEDIYNDFKFFIENNFREEGTKPLKEVHYKLRELIDTREWGLVNKFLKLFCHEGIDIGRLRMITIITQTFREEPKIKASLDHIFSILSRKLKTLESSK